MNILILHLGKTRDKCIAQLVRQYMDRSQKMFPVEYKEVDVPKKYAGLPESELKKREGELIMKNLQVSDYVVLLDEKGKQMSSMELAGFLEKKMHASVKRLVFITGGAYGFSKEMYERANEKLSLSRMTFSHQIVRILFAEQLYRAFTIIKGHPYHNE